MIAITICSTRSYAYAMIAQARKIQACIEREPNGVVILVGDDSPEIQKAKEFYESVLPEPRTVKLFKAGASVPEGTREEGWRVMLHTGKFEDGLPNYKNAAQLIIARMRSIAFDIARKHNADFCWSLDSDVLPPPNALRCMKQMLEFDDGYYSISTCPYPSQGGGAFIGGRGTPEHPILPDFYDDEREIPKQWRNKIERHKNRIKELKGKPDEKWMKDREKISEFVKRCKPIGNVFFCNSKGFRRRGWMEAAYPGIGKGSIVPSDWCGFGCTLMGKKALSMATFDGYDGGGTEDLYVVWKRWHRAGLRINAIPHAPCDHVIRHPDKKKKNEYVLCQAFHEYRDKECEGHLRIEPRPWYQATEGEVYYGPPR